jgi:hypothetical protein
MLAAIRRPLFNAENPVDLPVQQSTKAKLIITGKSKALGFSGSRHTVGRRLARLADKILVLDLRAIPTLARQCRDVSCVLKDEGASPAFRDIGNGFCVPSRRIGTDCRIIWFC